MANQQTINVPQLTPQTSFRESMYVRAEPTSSSGRGILGTITSVFKRSKIQDDPEFETLLSNHRNLTTFAHTIRHSVEAYLNHIMSMCATATHISSNLRAFYGKEENKESYQAVAVKFDEFHQTTQNESLAEAKSRLDALLILLDVKISNFTDVEKIVKERAAILNTKIFYQNKVKSLQEETTPHLDRIAQNLQKLKDVTAKFEQIHEEVCIQLREIWSQRSFFVDKVVVDLISVEAIFMQQMSEAVSGLYTDVRTKQQAKSIDNSSQKAASTATSTAASTSTTPAASTTSQIDRKEEEDKDGDYDAEYDHLQALSPSSVQSLPRPISILPVDNKDSSGGGKNTLPKSVSPNASPQISPSLAPVSNESQNITSFQLQEHSGGDDHDKIVNDILTTEITYVQLLTSLCESYVVPLKKSSDILNSKLHQKIFSNVELLEQFHRKFLADLTQKVGNKDIRGLGQVFLEFAHFFKMYTSYLVNYENACQSLESLATNKRYQEFIVKVSANTESITKLLALPVERVPQYRELLVRLLQNTDKKRPDFQNLTKAVGLISQVEQSINDSIRAQRYQLQILEIEKLFSPHANFISPSRNFIRRGPLIKKCRSSDIRYEFFLFSDLLIYGSKRVSGKYKLHRRFDINLSFNVSDLPDNAKECIFSFQITNSQKSFIVYTFDANLKKEWLQDLNTCILQMRNKINADTDITDVIAPVWKTDNSSKQCFVCNRSFSLFVRRHHCRNCGNLVCDSCSLTRMVLGEKKLKRGVTGLSTEPTSNSTKSEQNLLPQRVCDTCVKKLSESKVNKLEQQTKDLLLAIAPKSKVHRKSHSIGDTYSEQDKKDDNSVIPPPFPARSSITSTTPATTATPTVSPLTSSQQQPQQQQISSVKVTGTGEETNSRSANLSTTTDVRSGISSIPENEEIKGDGAEDYSNYYAIEAKEEKYQALYPYASENGDISFAPYEVIIITNKDNPNWWYARTTSGLEGYVPSNYIEPYTESSNPVPSTVQ